MLLCGLLLDAADLWRLLGGAALALFTSSLALEELHALLDLLA